MLVVDLPGAESVAFGTELSALAPVSLVLTFQNWPFDNELIPANETLSALVAFSPERNEAAAGSVPVFLLDSARLAYKDVAISEQTVDNRYALSSVDLPAPSVLQARGIRQVVYVVPSRSTTISEEDDLNPRFMEYEQAGMTLFFLGVDDLLTDDTAVEDTAVRVARLFSQWPFHVGRRPLCISDPRFFQRARSGFGGFHAAHVIGRLGHAAFGAAHGAGGHGGG
jgi:hypothetical protein